VQRPTDGDLLRRRQLLPAPFLDLSADVVTTGNFGLMSVAFHRDYQANGRLFVKYSAAPDGDTVVAEFAVRPVLDRRPGRTTPESGS